MSMPRTKSERVRRILLRRRIICAVCLIALILGIFAIIKGCKKEPQNLDNGGVSSSPSSSSDSGEPHIISSAKIGSTGDAIMHDSVLWTVEDKNYDFSGIFATVKPYYSAYDVMSINLEVTFGTNKNYKGYPNFNSPATLADALKGAGVDLLLTANNHSYDNGSSGFNNTITQLKNRKIAFIGSKSSADKNYLVKDVNGIKVGFACFTYSTVSGGNKALNGHIMNSSDGENINTFTYDNPTKFKTQAETIIDNMKKDGAEATVIYMHWGDEYAAKPSEARQVKFAKIINELGYDVIVGSHPHVIQAVDTLKNENGQETVCIYSTGNSISNQRKEIMSEDNHSGHTEDGVIFEVQFDKYSDGTVVLADVNALPTWVDMRTVGGEKSYNIIPLDLSKDWTSFNVSSISDAKASYSRTLKRIGQGLNEWRLSHGKPQIPLTAN